MLVVFIGSPAATANTATYKLWLTQRLLRSPMLCMFIGSPAATAYAARRKYLPVLISRIIVIHGQYMDCRISGWFKLILVEQILWVYTTGVSVII